MAVNRQCIDCEELSLAQGPQGEPGPEGAAGTAGNDGADGADGANILFNPTNEVGTTNAVGPQTLRTFTITPAMLPNVGDEILVTGTVTSFNMFPSPNGRITVLFGGASVFSWLGITGNPLIATEYYFEVTIRKDSNSSQYNVSVAHSGVENQVNYDTKISHSNSAVDTTINQDLTLTVNSAGVFQVDDMISRNFKVTQLKS